MKRTVFAFLAALLICAARAAAYAGDLPEAIITMPDTDVFIGEIIEISGESIKIDVSRALFDCYEVDTVTIDQFEYMDGGVLPGVGDYTAFAAEYADGGWRLVYGLAAKSDGLDPATLTLYLGESGFIERMNGYINDGTYSYETRREMLRASRPITENSPETALGEGDMQISEIARNTQIVTPPPVLAAAPPTGFLAQVGYWYDKPYVRYPFITLFSAVLSYFITRRVACRIEGKER